MNLKNQIREACTLPKPYSPADDLPFQCRIRGEVREIVNKIPLIIKMAVENGAKPNPEKIKVLLGPVCSKDSNTATIWIQIEEEKNLAFALFLRGHETESGFKERVQYANENFFAMFSKVLKEERMQIVCEENGDFFICPLPEEPDPNFRKKMLNFLKRKN